MDALMSLAARVRKAGIATPGVRVLVAFSGGADSTALALAAAAAGADAVLGHVDHRMRPDSTEHARACEAFAVRRGMPISTRALSPAPTSEAGARSARYEALAAMAQESGARLIATAHTADDQAETALIRWARGGLPAGMPDGRGNLVRPLLGVRRPETEAACAAAGEGFLTDPSNADEAMLRNFIRRRVLAGVDEGIVRRLAAVGSRAQALASGRARRSAELAGALARYADPPAVVSLDRAALRELDPSDAAGVVRHALAPMPGEATARLVGDIVAKVLPATGAGLCLPGGWEVWCEPDALCAGPVEPPGVLPPVELARPGTVESPEWGLAFSVDEPGDAEGALLLDASGIDAPLRVRQRAPGDRIRLAGTAGTKKLQDLFVDARVPRRRRDRIPVLVCGERVVAAGGSVSAEFIAGPGTTRTLGIRIFPLLRGKRGGQ